MRRSFIDATAAHAQQPMCNSHVQQPLTFISRSALILFSRRSFHACIMLTLRDPAIFTRGGADGGADEGAEEGADEGVRGGADERAGEGEGEEGEEGSTSH